MNILYYSAHSILEYDEVKLFTEMGHNVYSLGAYQNSNDGDLRGPIPNLYDNPHLRSVAIQCSKENTHQELIDWADVLFLMHNARVSVEDHPQPWLKGNWEKFKKSKKPIIWRGIGQSNAQVEQALQEFVTDGLKIVRHSPLDSTIPHYAGSSAMIRFYKDPEEYAGYNGQIPRIINLSQALYGSPTVNSRGDHMCIEFFKQAVDGYDWKVFGPDNDNAGEHNGGLLSFEDLKQMLRFNRVFYYVGTRPANYTLGFIEAMMTGIPIVSIGPEHGNEIYTDQKTFEAHELIGDGGYWSDSVTQTRKYIAELLNNQGLAFELGNKGRARAIELFGKDKIRKDWEAFFATL
jgi:glycosyltransferase involved in cell wall biosynthesis